VQNNSHNNETFKLLFFFNIFYKSKVLKRFHAVISGENMFYRYLLLISLLIQNISFTQAQDENDYESRYGSGTEEFEFNKFDNDSILLAIKRDMEVACDKRGLCTLSAVTSRDHRFTAQFNIGEGYNPIGYQGTGTTVILPGSAGYPIGTEPYYGINLRFTKAKCTQTIQVPRSLYISMNRYMYGLMNEEGETRRGFSPADEAMIMFYSTIMKQATGCVAGQ
jgi:hypothetical protein